MNKIQHKHCSAVYWLFTYYGIHFKTQRIEQKIHSDKNKLSYKEAHFTDLRPKARTVAVNLIRA